MEEEEYFRMIEEYFLQKRGNPMLLSPGEWSLIGEWYQTGIPQEVVLKAIDRAFQKREEETKPLSLSYCRPLVRSEYKRHLKSLAGKTPATDKTEDVKNVGEYLERLHQSLIESSEYAKQEGNETLAEFLLRQSQKFFQEILTMFQQDSNDLQRVELKLTTLEKEIEQVLLQMISDERMQNLKEEAMRDLKSFQEKLDLPVYQEMLRRALIKSVRKLYRIPRLSLFYM
jgi:hypothetical protein